MPLCCNLLFWQMGSQLLSYCLLVPNSSFRSLVFKAGGWNLKTTFLLASCFLLVSANGGGGGGCCRRLQGWSWEKGPAPCCLFLSASLLLPVFPLLLVCSLSVSCPCEQPMFGHTGFPTLKFEKNLGTKASIPPAWWPAGLGGFMPSCLCGLSFSLSHGVFYLVEKDRNSSDFSHLTVIWVAFEFNS